MSPEIAVPKAASRKSSGMPIRPPAAGAILEPRAARLLTNLRKIQKDPSNEAAIHDARVAARRLLVAGDLWAPEAPEWEWLRSRLGKIVRRVGRVRNLDVTLRFLVRRDGRDRHVRDALVEALKKQRRKERRRLSEWLTGRRIRTLESQLQWSDGPSGNGQGSVRPDASDLDPYFARLLDLAARVRRSSEAEIGHEARRELRRLRYAHETLSWAYGRDPFRAAARRFAHVQDLAGRWHDLWVLERLATKAARKGKVSVRLNDFLKHLRSEARALVPRMVKEMMALEELRSPVSRREVP